MWKSASSVIGQPEFFTYFSSVSEAGSQNFRMYAVINFGLIFIKCLEWISLILSDPLLLFIIFCLNNPSSLTPFDQELACVRNSTPVFLISQLKQTSKNLSEYDFKTIFFSYSSHLSIIYSLI